MLGGFLAVMIAAAAPAQEENSDPAASSESDSAFLGPNVGLGPFRALTVSPLGSLRPGLLALPPSTLREGSVEVQLTADWANIWAIDEGRSQLDYEVLVTNLSLAYGLDDRLRVELAFADGARFGGTLDPLIIWFHQLVGARQRGRTDSPENDFQFELHPGHGKTSVVLTNEDRGSFSQALQGSLQYTYPGERGWPPALSGALTFRGEVGDTDLEGGSPVDVAASVSSAIAFGDFYAYLGGSVAWFGRERFHGLALRTVQLSGFLAIEWNFATPASFIIRYQVIEGSLDSDGPFSRPTHESTIGFKLEAWNGVLFELAMIENHANPYNSADFGIHAGLTLRW